VGGLLAVSGEWFAANKSSLRLIMFGQDFLKFLFDEGFTTIGRFIGDVEVDGLLLIGGILVELILEVTERVIEGVLPEL
jgi:hypothetical protein